MAQYGLKTVMVPPVPVEELQKAFLIFSEKFRVAVETQKSDAPAKLPGLGDCDDDLDFDDPADTALSKTGDALDQLGYAANVTDNIAGRAYGLHKIMEKLKCSELNDAFLEVAANLPLPGAASQFRTAEFLKALKKKGLAWAPY